MTTIMASVAAFFFGLVLGPVVRDMLVARAKRQIDKEFDEEFSKRIKRDK